MQDHAQQLDTQFMWWVGVVEDRHDPLKAGRYRVRIFGAHTSNKSDLPTDQLPWAQPMLSTNSTTTPILKEGDFVIGFYFDGADQQTPIIMGALPGIPTELRPASQGFSDPRTSAQLQSSPKYPKSLTVSGGPVSIVEGSGQRNPHPLHESTLSRVARNDKSNQTAIQFKRNSVTSGVPVAGGGSWSEPSTPYSAQYPYNQVIDTEAGHLIELDDTPGAERVHVYHRSGSFLEIHPDGTMVLRSHANKYEVVLGDNNIFVQGDVNITSSGDINLKAGQNLTLEAGGDIKLASLGQFTSQATLQTHFSAGAMNLNGIPLNLNGPGAVAGQTPTPVTVITAGTFTFG